jgi:hypothetical protein
MLFFFADLCYFRLSTSFLKSVNSLRHLKGEGAETSNKNVDVVSNRAETNTPDKRKNNGSTSKQGKVCNNI